MYGLDAGLGAAGLPASTQRAATLLAMSEVEALVVRTEARRQRIGTALDAKSRAQHGQYFTPDGAAELIANMPRLPQQGALRILDPGAGVGSLTAALVARILRDAPALHVEVVAVELDSVILPHLEETLQDCIDVATAQGTHLQATAINDDLLEIGLGFGRHGGPLADPFDIVITNPPYKKLSASSPERRALAAEGADCSNLYSAFLAVSAMMLRPAGQLVAITPRSFANGPYFGQFRRFLLSQTALDRVHVFESRSTVFRDSAVLQENVIFSATKDGTSDSIILSVSHGHTDDVTSRAVPYAEVVKPTDRNQFIHIPTNEEDTSVAEFVANLPCTLSDLNVKVSTGKVVDFRATEYLLEQPEGDCHPLIYPGNLRNGHVHWPLPIRKPQGLVAVPGTKALLLPGEHYVLVKRFSSKEERRRVVAFVYDSDEIQAPFVGFENHLNVYHRGGHGLPRELMRGLCLWLNSSIVDKFFRTFSGHTQVNATDLRSLRYPGLTQLEALGAALGAGDWPDQAKIDSLVDAHVISSEGTA